MSDQLDNTVWGKFRKRAQELQKASQSMKEISDAEKEKIFNDRSLRLREEKDKSADDKDLLKIISFHIAGEYYGINVRYLREIYEVFSITRIPCTPPVFFGLTNYRGTVLSIINLRVLFNLQEENFSNENGPNKDDNVPDKDPSLKVLIIDYSGTQIGIVIDRLDTLLELPINSIQPVTSFFQDKNKIVKSEAHINNTPLLIIDPEELLNDQRLIVNEDV